MSLIHWWPLNGDLNNKINGKKLTQNIETSYIAGKLGKAIKFNGYPAEYQFTSEEVNVLNQNKNSCSVACWIKLDSSQNGWGQIITLGDYGTDWNNIRLGLDNQPNERVWFTISNGTTNMGYKCGSNSNLQDNQWHHLAGVYSNRKLTMYVDGVKQTLDSTSTFDPAFNPTSYVMIGGNHNGEKPICAIADVRVYDHALSLAEIQELKKALIVHYTFDDVLIEPTANQTGMLYNETGLTQPNSNTIQNVQLVTDAAISRYSLKCNNTKILIPITGDISQGATLSLWINLPKDSNGNNIFPSSSEVVVADNNSQLALGFFNGAHGIITCADFTKPMMTNLKTALVNDWNHIAVLRDRNNNIKGYLNGIEYPLTDNQEWTHSEPYFSIGCRYSSGWTSYYNGQVDDIRLYHTALSPEEIKELYNCGGRISNLGDALTGEFIEGAEKTSVNKNHTITTKEIYEQILPTGYQQLEYIDSDGNAYIDTGYTSNNKPYQIDCDMEIIGPVQTNYWFGQTQAHGAMMYNGLYANNRIEFNWTTIYREVNRRCIMTQTLSQDGNQTVISMNGVSTTVNTGNNDSVGNFYIFACNNGSRPYASQMRLYSFTLKENNFPVRNFIPARNPSGALGLYDIINNQFYTNAGSGNFIAGPTLTTGQASMLRAGGLTAREIIEI